MCHVVGRDRIIDTPLNMDKPLIIIINMNVFVTKLLFLNKYKMED